SPEPSGLCQPPERGFAAALGDGFGALGRGAAGFGAALGADFSGRLRAAAAALGLAGAAAAVRFFFAGRFAFAAGRLAARSPRLESSCRSFASRFSSLR